MSLHRHAALKDARGAHRGHWVSICALGAVSAVCLGVVPQAEAAVKAPGYFAGPKVTSAGLLWEGREGVFLSAHAGTRLLIPDAELSAVQVEDGWVVMTDASGAKVGRIGQPPRVVEGLRRCRPLPGYSESEELEAVANDNLYAVVDAKCLSRRARNAQFLVRVRLGAEHLHVIGRVPSGAISLAAAGSRLALTYTLSARRVRVEVVDSRNAHLLYWLAPPREAPDPVPGNAPIGYQNTQIDSEGNVLVSRREQLPLLPGGEGEAFGWWGTPRTRVGRPLNNGVLHASLSEGRIAYATGHGREIDVLNLATGTTRTIVTFSGSVRPAGLELSNGVLAWARQSYAYQFTTEDCVGYYALGFAELTATPLSAAGLPIAVEANPGTPPTGMSCPIPPSP
jgi:hypothetical protein